MSQSLLHIAFKNFITKCGRLLQNVITEWIENVLHNAALLHNVALQAGICAQCRKLTISNSSQAISLISTKLCTFLSWEKIIKRILIFQTILKLLKLTASCTFGSKHEVLHISTLVCPNDMKLRWLLPHEPLRLCEKMINLLFRTPHSLFDPFATKFASSICGKHIKSFDLHHTWWGGPFLCFAIKPSTHYNFHIQFAIYSKLLKHAQGLALNTFMWHNPMAACPNTCGLWGPVHSACSFN